LIGRDLDEVLDALFDKKYKVIETKSIFTYEGKRLKVVRIKDKGEFIEITVIRI
jgi:adenylate cyclase class IV